MSPEEINKELLRIWMIGNRTRESSQINDLNKCINRMLDDLTYLRSRIHSK